ncbi:MAG: S8 family serine peptidase [Gammaproteobacteria bacterium]|nr:S8 family serine peptidase [Gammaproteobacteria bacterium]
MNRGLLCALLTWGIITAPPTLAAEPQSWLVISASHNVPASLERQIAAAGGRVIDRFSAIGVAVVESGDPDFGNKIPGAQFVARNLSVNWLPGNEDAVFFEEAGLAPNSGDDDAFLDMQWGHNAVRAQAAWAAGQTGQGVRVAVLDSGIDHDHPDLAPNLNATLSKSFVDGEDWRIGPGVYFNHGSHVAGTIGAADNGTGIIGVSPGVELVAIKVLSEHTGNGAFSGVIGGVLYAADIGARVINMSLGATLVRRGVPDVYNAQDVAGLSVAFNRAAMYAIGKGAVVIASEGNSAIDKDHTASVITLPADATGVTSISATAPYGWLTAGWNGDYNGLASYSNFGFSATQFGAPGGDYSYGFSDPGSLCTAAARTRPCYVFDYVFSTGSQAYYWAVGTSMAAPHASAVAAIIIGENDGNITSQQVTAEMLRRADGTGRTAETGAGVVSTGY